jgi:hypothetical protein
MEIAYYGEALHKFRNGVLPYGRSKLYRYLVGGYIPRPGETSHLKRFFPL